MPGGSDHPQQAVGTDTGAAITQPRDVFGTQRMIIVDIGNDDEVVAGSVAFGESDRCVHVTIMPRGRNTRDATGGCGDATGLQD